MITYKLANTGRVLDGDMDVIATYRVIRQGELELTSGGKTYTLELTVDDLEEQMDEYGYFVSRDLAVRRDEIPTTEADVESIGYSGGRRWR